MAAIRIFVVALTCLSLGLPLAIWSPCCCETAEVASTNSCPTDVGGPSCCHASEAIATSGASQDICEQCMTACICSDDASAAAVLIASSKPDVALAFACWPIAFLAIPADFSLLALCGSLVPIPIGHNRRLATLCVWRK